jgi:CRP-like cAMP-binding protein
VAALAEITHAQAGEAIFFEARPADSLYLLDEGCIDLFHNAEAPGIAHARAAAAVYQLLQDGADIPLLGDQTGVLAELKVGEIGPGEIVGMSALIPPYVLTATARARHPSRLVRVDAVALRQAGERQLELINRLLIATGQVALARLQYARSRLVNAVA